MQQSSKRNKHSNDCENKDSDRTEQKESIKNCQDFVQFLPQEIILKIFSELDVQSLTNATATCKEWNYLIENSDSLWYDHCLTALAVCKKELLNDRASGLSWKVTLVKNFKKSNLKRAWLDGRYSCIGSAKELLQTSMCEMDADTWGEILEAELAR
uniref:F-box protein 48 n=1 Tax=Callorhinchus milii TaxID=7868 RepID=A0A4W3KKP2_CALMI|eukprot:gi/632949978/ref/XP_007890470.1/ PREDICTED: F-box only protein 48 [Callorhinchus milii]